jgi:hypothetical protein
MRKKSETMHFRLSAEYWRVITELSEKTGATVSDIARTAIAQLCTASMDADGYLRTDIVCGLQNAFGVPVEDGGTRKKGRPLSQKRTAWSAPMPSLWDQPQADSATEQAPILYPEAELETRHCPAPGIGPQQVIYVEEKPLEKEAAEEEREANAAYAEANAAYDRERQKRIDFLPNWDRASKFTDEHRANRAKLWTLHHTNYKDFYKSLLREQEKVKYKATGYDFGTMIATVERLAVRLTTEEISEMEGKMEGRHAVNVFTSEYIHQMGVECILYRLEEIHVGRIAATNAADLPAQLDPALADEVAYGITNAFNYEEIHAMPPHQLVHIFSPAYKEAAFWPAYKEAAFWYAKEIEEAARPEKQAPPAKRKKSNRIPPPIPEVADAVMEADGSADNSGFIPSAGCSLSERIEEHWNTIRNCIKWEAESGEIDEDAFNEAYLQLETLPFGERKIMVHLPAAELVTQFVKMYNTFTKRAAAKQRKRREHELTDNLADFIAAKKSREDGDDN